jgi:lipoic acid synthetase
MDATPPLIIPPPWLMERVRRAKTKSDPAAHGDLRGQLALLGLNTVCDGACCPNRGSCFSRGTATFMILGDTCTRDCTFCAVKHGRPAGIDQEEPLRLKLAVENLGLTHAVVTSVTRDDLPDGGAGQFAAVIEALHKIGTSPTVEVLTPDFGGSSTALNTVLTAGPEVFSHNVETVPRLYPTVRPAALYRRSLDLLAGAAQKAQSGAVVKTGFMLGLGEERGEVIALLDDLRAAGVAMLTIGQYLAPSLRHHPVMRYVTPGEFDDWASLAREMGFKSVVSGPLVRSSYHAADSYREVRYAEAQKDH